ncbi:MAG: hypothetical protein AB7S38_41850 [Vulcanimicrobiota bacterium]
MLGYRSFLCIALLMFGLACSSPEPEVTPTPETPLWQSTLERGEEFLADENFLAAQIQAEQALKLLAEVSGHGPEKIQARKLLAQASYKAKNLDVAVEQFRILHKVEPKAGHDKTAALIAGELSRRNKNAHSRDVNEALGRARKAYNERDYYNAAEAAREVLKLGENGEARAILAESEAAKKGVANKRHQAFEKRAYGARPPRRLSDWEASQLPDDRKVQVQDGNKSYWTTSAEWRRYQREGGHVANPYGLPNYR